MSAARPAVKIIEPHWKPGVQRQSVSPEPDPSEPGKRDIEGADKDTQTDNEIIASHLITRKLRMALMG